MPDSVLASVLVTEAVFTDGLSLPVREAVAKTEVDALSTAVSVLVDEISERVADRVFNRLSVAVLLTDTVS